MVRRNGQVITTITLSEDIVESLDAFCKATGWHRTGVIRQAVKEFLGKPKHQRIVKKQKERSESNVRREKK